MNTPPLFVVGAETGALNTRRLNRQRLLEAIRRLGPISRADLSKRTHLSPPTVSALVEELAGEASLLREIGVGISSGGRPPILLEFNADYGCLVGVDIGARVINYALADLQGRVLARIQQPTRTDSRDGTIGQLLDGIDGLFRQSGRDVEKLFAVGIGAPGITDVTTGRVLHAAHLGGWTDVPLRDVVRSRFDVPVQVDNRANMAALGERWQGVARQINDFVFLALGAGIGAGVVIGGRLHRGHQSSAGEIGRMTLDYRAWQADAAERGYLESRIGAAALAEWTDVRTFRARAGTASASAIPLVLDAAEAGDPEATRIVEDLAVFVGNAVANIVAVLDPGLVVFGGDLSHAGDRLLEPVRRVVRKIVPNLPSFEVSALGDDAPLFGSVYSAMEAAEAQLFAIAGSPGVRRAATMPRAASR